jgi:hypothetical protein
VTVLVVVVVVTATAATAVIGRASWNFPILSNLMRLIFSLRAEIWQKSIRLDLSDWIRGDHRVDLVVPRLFKYLAIEATRESSNFFRAAICAHFVDQQVGNGCFLSRKSAISIDNFRVCVEKERLFIATISDNRQLCRILETKREDGSSFLRRIYILVFTTHKFCIAFVPCRCFRQISFYWFIHVVINVSALRSKLPIRTAKSRISRYTANLPADTRTDTS